jgi:hypothetical protein
LNIVHDDDLIPALAAVDGVLSDPTRYGTDLLVERPESVLRLPEPTPTGVLTALLTNPRLEHRVARYVETADALANDLDELGLSSELVDLFALAPGRMFAVNDEDGGALTTRSNTAAVQNRPDILLGSDRDDLLNGDPDQEANDDRIWGGGGIDQLFGGGQNDILAGGAGWDQLFGGGGADVGWFAGARSDFQIVHLAASLLVRDRRPASLNGQGTDTLIGVERLRFDDSVYDVATRTFSPIDPAAATDFLV